MCFNPCTLAGCNNPWFAVFSKIYISTHAPLHGAPLQTRTETCFSRPQNYKINPLINLPAAASRSWASRPFVHPIPPFPPARPIRNHKRVNGPRHFLFFVFTTHIAPFWISSKTFGKLFKKFFIFLRTKPCFSDLRCVIRISPVFSIMGIVA